MDLRAYLITIAAASIAASPVAAQTQQTAPAPTQQKPAKDPNEIVCERQEELGSRLNSTKVCHTRAEWADLRHQDRQTVEKAQMNVGMQGK